ncbi:MAG: YeeE/YedE thiosulfate transporter family protein [Bacillota bacterium]|nr:YeeE/YedE thiosulfate transporter family protein [Bacillota bacterium]
MGLILGIIIGWILYSNRICFANMFVQTIYLKDRRGFEYLFLYLIFATVTIGVAQLALQVLNMPLQQSNWQVGIPTIIGAVIFGVGMTIAGSCTGTTLVRIGEGTKTYILVALGIAIGFNLGDIHYLQWWDSTVIFTKRPLWDIMPWSLALLLQLVVLTALYILFKGGWKNEKS